MASIKAGTYTFAEVFQAAGYDFEGEAAADYLDGQPDFRRVRVGGLGFDDLEDTFTVPYTANELEITLDGKQALLLDVDLDEEDEEFRRRSFETAADAEDTGTARMSVEEQSRDTSVEQ